MKRLAALAVLRDRFRTLRAKIGSQPWYQRALAWFGTDHFSPSSGRENGRSMRMCSPNSDEQLRLSRESVQTVNVSSSIQL